MHNGNNNCPFPTRPALKANSGGIEDGLVVVAKLEQQDIEPHRSQIARPGELNAAQPSEKQEAHMDCQTSPRAISAEQQDCRLRRPRAASRRPNRSSRYAGAA